MPSHSTSILRCSLSSPHDQHPPRITSLRFACSGVCHRYRNLQTAVNYLRLLHKVSKGKQARIIGLHMEKAANILKRSLKVDHPELKLYTLKVCGCMPRGAMPQVEGRGGATHGLPRPTIVLLGCCCAVLFAWFKICKSQHCRGHYPPLFSPRLCIVHVVLVATDPEGPGPLPRQVVAKVQYEHP